MKTKKISPALIFIMIILFSSLQLFYNGKKYLAGMERLFDICQSLWMLVKYIFSR